MPIDACRPAPDATTVTPANPPLPNGSVLLAEAETGALRQLVAAEWVSGAARLLGVSRSAVSAALAGTGVRRGTAEMIARRLREIAADADDSAPALANGTPG
jgi:hypothetical protein